MFTIPKPATTNPKIAAGPTDFIAIANTFDIALVIDVKALAPALGICLNPALIAFPNFGDILFDIYPDTLESLLKTFQILGPSFENLPVALWNLKDICAIESPTAFTLSFPIDMLPLIKFLKLSILDLVESGINFENLFFKLSRYGDDLFKAFDKVFPNAFDFS